MTGTLPAADDALPVATGRETAREMWRLGRGHRLVLATLVVLGIASTTINLIGPVAIGFLIDQVQAGTADLGTVLTATTIMAASAILGTAGTAATTVLAARTYHTILAGLREQLVARALTMPQHRVERAGTGDLISRSSDDVNTDQERPYAAAFAVVVPSPRGTSPEALRPVRSAVAAVGAALAVPRTSVRHSSATPGVPWPAPSPHPPLPDAAAISPSCPAVSARPAC